MRRESQIRHKLKQVIFRHRKRFVEKGLARHPENCVYNRGVHLPLYTANRTTLRVCDYADEKDQTHDVVCDATMGGEIQAKKCPYFECCNTPESLKEVFALKLEVEHTGRLAKEYPDLIALMWVLGSNHKQGKQEVAETDGNILAFFGTEDGESMVVSDEPLLDTDLDGGE